MDFIKNAVSSATGDKEHKTTENNTNQQKDDYGDKVFAAGVKKSGYNIDRSTQEKITDGAREAFEKVTGKQVSDKFSN